MLCKPGEWSNTPIENDNCCGVRVCEEVENISINKSPGSLLTRAFVIYMLCELLVEVE